MMDRRRSRSRLITIFLVLASFVSAGVWCFGYNGVSRIADFLDAISVAGKTFTVTGTVVDEDGQPLNDTLLSIRATRSDLSGKKSNEYNSTVAVNGTFRVELSGYRILHLNFDRKGYEGAYLGFKQSGTFNVRVVMLRRQPISKDEK